MDFELAAICTLKVTSLYISSLIEAVSTTSSSKTVCATFCSIDALYCKIASVIALDISCCPFLEFK